VNFVNGCYTPLHYAAWKNNVESLKLLIEHGANINQNDEEGNTALMWATSEEVWQFLIKQGADINKQNNDGLTPLDLALRMGSYKACKYLIKKGVDTNKENDREETPLQLAAQNNYYKTCKDLIEKGADVNKKNKYGETALHLAVSRSHYRIFTYLVDHNADVNLQNNQGETPLHVAVCKNWFKACKYLVERGADINKKNNKGETPLYVAVLKNYFKACKYLIEKGADVNKKNNEGETALHTAVRSGLHVIGTYLVEHNADVNVENKKRETPLHYAILKGDVEIYKYLIEHGANVNEAVFGTAMHIAAASNQVGLLNILIERTPADVNATRKRDNWSPLHCAAIWGNLDAVKCLIEHRANIQAEDKYGKTPVQVASNHEVIAYMNSSSAKPRTRRSLGVSPIPYQYTRHRVIDDEGRFWSVENSSGEGSSLFWGDSFASQLQNFFPLFQLVMRNLPLLVEPRIVFETIEQTLQHRMDSVAENAIEALPVFEE
jgi:ankyrin repeat protein